MDEPVAALDGARSRCLSPSLDDVAGPRVRNEPLTGRPARCQSCASLSALRGPCRLVLVGWSLSLVLVGRLVLVGWVLVLAVPPWSLPLPAAPCRSLRDLSDTESWAPLQLSGGSRTMRRSDFPFQRAEAPPLYSERSLFDRCRRPDVCNQDVDHCCATAGRAVPRRCERASGARRGGRNLRRGLPASCRRGRSGVQAERPANVEPPLGVHRGHLEPPGPPARPR